MLSREERILSEILVSRGLVMRERIESCVRLQREGPGPAASRSLVDLLVDGGDLVRSDADDATEEARSIDKALAPELPAGMCFGEFRLVREIGRGGMGIVYEAEQESLGRRVALKILPAGAALDERLAIRFLREARAAGRLRHPGIVSVYSSGRAAGVLYYAMELIEGSTLAAHLVRGPLDPRDAARIAAEVARALDHAHAEGLVHRDVKPDNVLLSADGRARIADFGLVHEASAGSFTLSRHVLGTPAFVAPEQARGERVDARSDVYGLGAVLYAMLAGGPPYGGEVASLVLARVVTERPPALASLRPGLPERLVAVCERAMARYPTERYASAGALAEALETCLRPGEPQPVDAPAPPPERSRSWTAPRIAGALGAGVVVAGLVLVGSIVARRAATGPAPSLRSRTEFMPSVGPPGLKLSPTLSPDGKWLAYASDADGDWDVYLVDPAGGGAPANVTEDLASDEKSLAFSPDGHALAFTSFSREASEIWVTELASGARRVVGREVASGLAWSSDGRELYFNDQRYGGPGTAAASSSRLLALDIATGSVRALTGIYGTQPTASGTGTLAFVGQSGGRSDLWVLPESGGEAVRITDDDALEWSPVWSPDGRELYFGSDRGGTGGLFKIALDRTSGGLSGEPLRLTTVVLPAPFFLARGGAGDWPLVFASTSHGGMLCRLTLSSGSNPRVEAVSSLPGRFLAAVSPDVSRDGTLVYTAVTAHEDIAVGEPSGTEPRLLTEDAFADRSPRFSPDGSLIAFRSNRSGKMEIWTIRPDGSGLEQRTLTSGDTTAPVWSPDGTRFAVSEEGVGTLILPITSNDPRAVETLPPFEEAGVAFVPSSWSADGRTLAGAGRGIVLYSFAERRFRRLTDRGEAPLWLDHRRLLYTTEREIRLLDSRSGGSSLLHTAAPARVEASLSVSADGTSVWASVSVSAEELWRVALKE